jgi:hypothetical protein
VMTRFRRIYAAGKMLPGKRRRHLVCIATEIGLQVHESHEQ